MNRDIIVTSGMTICDPQAGLITPIGGSSVLSVGPSMMRNGNEPYHAELQYLALLQELVDKTEGAVRDDRTGTGTYSVFGRSMRFDLNHSFPILTTKKVNFRAVVAELLWILSGSTNIKDLDAKIWDEWADENGELGPVYGKQWRNWQTVKGADRWIEGAERMLSQAQTLGDAPKVLNFSSIDQISELIQNLKDKPNDRGHVVSAWNVGDLKDMALRPCHCLFQFYVEDGHLSCQLYQRSADIFLGVPFNLSSYALLTHLIAREVGLKVGEFIHTFGDLHLYSNHVEQAKEQLTRTPRPFPQLFMQDDTVPKGIFDWVTKDIEVLNYDPHPAIKGEVSV